MRKVCFPRLDTGIEALGDWNPQLMREIQGRFKLRSVLITLLSSLVGQGVFLFWRYRTLEMRFGRCETADFQKTGKDCVQAGTHYFLVNWPEWWLEVFTWSCIFLMFALVVGGSFLLISDLSKEERQGTLTFISLSPQTARTILLGKMVGVPLLLFLAVFLALPLHYVSGLSAQIPLARTFGFDLLLLGSCFFFYSLALMIGLVGNWLGGFQSWLGSAGIFMLLLLLKHNAISTSSADWLYLFSPTVILPYVTHTLDHLPDLALPFGHENLLEWQWFTVSFGHNGLLVLLFALVNYGLWAGWFWQPLQRRFRNPRIPLLSKKQSYLATICFITCSLGFSVNNDPNSLFEASIAVILSVHLLWFLLLIVLLLPHHQALEDWARFRRSDRSAKGRMQRTRDLVWADNSPAWVAIALNLAIAGIPMMAWFLSLPGKEQQMIGLVALSFNSTLILIFALFNQIILLMPITNRNLWTTTTLIGATILPSFLLAILGVQPGQAGGSLILLTPFAFAAIEKTAVMSILQMFVVHLGAIAGLTWQLNRQLQRLGESTTLRLLRGNGPVEQG